MTNNQTILIAAAIVSVGLMIGLGQRPVAAASGNAFELMHHSNATANVGIFRLDTVSGEVSYCYIPNDAAKPVCTATGK